MVQISCFEDKFITVSLAWDTAVFTYKNKSCFCSKYLNTQGNGLYYSCPTEQNSAWKHLFFRDLLHVFLEFPALEVQLSANLLLKPCITLDLSNSHLKKSPKEKRKVKFGRQTTLSRCSDLTELEGVRAGKLLSLNIKALTIYTENNAVKPELCAMFQSNEAESLMEITSSQYSASSLPKLFLFNFQAQKLRQNALAITVVVQLPMKRIMYVSCFYLS